MKQLTAQQYPQSRSSVLIHIHRRALCLNPRQIHINYHHGGVAFVERNVGWLVPCCVVVDSRAWELTCGDIG